MIFHDDASQTEPSYWPDEILVTQITAIISNDRTLLTPRIIQEYQCRHFAKVTKK